MRRWFHYGMLLALAAALIACSRDKSAQETAGAGVSPSAPAEPAAKFPPPIDKVTIPQGTKFRIALIDGVSTDKSAPGDPFAASLIDPIVIGGKTILNKGTKVHGHVTDVQEPGRVKGLASIGLVLTDLERNGRKVPITTKPFVGIARNTKKRDAEVVGGGAGVGTLIGALAGGGKGAAIGAAIGGGAGTGTVLATKGKDLHYGPETRLSFTLAISLEI